MRRESVTDGFARATCEAPPGTTSHSANCSNAVGDVTDVGSYTASASPNGTFDQGGNLWEWNEAVISHPLAPRRGLRGSAFSAGSFDVSRGTRVDFDPSNAVDFVDFRVASSVPASAVPSLSPLGMALLWSLLGLASWWRLRR